MYAIEAMAMGMFALGLMTFAMFVISLPFIAAFHGAKALWKRLRT